MLLNSRQFKFLKNYRNVNVKSSAKREYRDENVFLNVFHFFKSRSSDIVLLKLGNLNQNAKRYKARNTEREVHICRNAKRATRMCERSEQIFFYYIYCS